MNSSRLGTEEQATMPSSTNRLGHRAQLRLRWSTWPTRMRIGAIILAGFAAVAVTAPWWVPYDPYAMNLAPPFSPSSASHWFGTDSVGRDVFSRTMVATRIELLIAIPGTLLGAFLGALLGLWAAYRKGWFDEVSMRVVEALISIPFIILALLIVSAVGLEIAGSLALMVAILAVIYAPRMARVARSAAYEVAERDYVTVARLRGDRAWTILRRDLLAGSSGAILVEFAVRLGTAPVVIGSLGFLGFGVRAPTPEWGAMVAENRNAIFASPVSVLGPSLVLAGFVIGVGLFADGLAERMIGRQRVRAQ
jgi:peptide/nickel transport system permease protein